MSTVRSRMGTAGPPMPGLSRGTRDLMIAIGAVSVLALVVDRLLGWPRFGYELALSWSGLTSGHLWQLVTHGFSHYDPLTRSMEPLGLIFAFIVLWWAGGVTESLLGYRRFWTFTAATIAISGLVGAGLLALFGHPALPLSGSWPLVAAMIAMFALAMPEQQIFLMFVIPLKAKYLLYVEIAIALLNLLNVGVAAVPPLVGIGVGVAWASGRVNPRLAWLKLRAWWIARRLRARRRPFEVVRGKDEYLH